MDNYCWQQAQKNKARGRKPESILDVFLFNALRKVTLKERFYKNCLNFRMEMKLAEAALRVRNKIRDFYRMKYSK